MPLRENYADRIYSTEVVSYPGMVHIGKDLDFTPVIEKSLELGGYKEDKRLTGINGGIRFTPALQGTLYRNTAVKLWTW